MKTAIINEFAPLFSQATEASKATTGPELIDYNLVQRAMARARAERSAAIGSALRKLPGAFLGLLRDIAKRVAAHSARRRNIRALLNLDDRMLRDLGIDRGQVEGLVNNGVTGFHFERSMPEAKPPANEVEYRRYVA